MIEIPEAVVLARQLTAALVSKTIRRAAAAQTPHGFAWYAGDPAAYAAHLTGKTVGNSVNIGGMVEIDVEDRRLVFTDGINLRFHATLAQVPAKHQLLLEFADETALSATVAMYGGLFCIPQGPFENPYYNVAREKPSPLTAEFSGTYFDGLFTAETDRMPLKAFLATQQRIPGLGNGVLQDILFAARLHPRRKTASLGADEKERLYRALVDTLQAMTDAGGRDTERDLFGNPGGYRTRMSKNTVGQACWECGRPIQKQSFLGGSIYFCPGCQPES